MLKRHKTNVTKDGINFVQWNRTELSPTISPFPFNMLVRRLCPEYTYARPTTLHSWFFNSVLEVGQHLRDKLARKSIWRVQGDIDPIDWGTSYLIQCSLQAGAGPPFTRGYYSRVKLLRIIIYTPFDVKSVMCVLYSCYDLRVGFMIYSCREFREGRLRSELHLSRSGE